MPSTHYNQVQKLTEEEIDSIRACSTAEDWAVILHKIKFIRGGNYPPDWYDKIVSTGEARRIVNSVMRNVDNLQIYRLSDAIKMVEVPTRSHVSLIRMLLIESEKVAPEGKQDRTMNDSLWLSARRVCQAIESLQQAVSHWEEQLELRKGEM